MKFKQEKKLLKFLKDQIDQQASSSSLVALDADGTLWPEDANDHLMEYQRVHRLRDLEDLFDSHYEKDENRAKRCEIFAQRQAGFSPKELRFHCLSALRAKPLHVFSFQKELLAYLKQKDIPVLIVSSSLKQMIEVAVEFYRLPVVAVLAVETVVEKGCFTDQIKNPAPLSDFKGQVFLEYSSGQKCFLAGGNTLSDLPLLKMSTCPFVVHSASVESELFLAERKLRNQALKNNWTLFEHSLFR